MWERYNVAGQQAMSQGKQAEAEKHFQLAVTEAEKFGPKDNRLVTSLNNLANCLRAQGRYGESDPVYKRAIQAKEASDGPFHEGLVSILENYATMLKACGRESEAEKHTRRARGIFTMKK
ncbi:MAG: tetratricopeptide repeat protein [Candidatus Obscuribacterales bacterium]|nr:tetratricopeptide repeat protein [Candidatus Obscuribacterales bacterium]